MKHMRIIWTLGLLVSLVAIGLCGNAFAGAGEPGALQDYTICGPEAWATVVIKTDGSDYTLTVRAKQIENCVVSKDAFLEKFSNLCFEDTVTPYVDCPMEENEFINYVFGSEILNIPVPIITKVKNFLSKQDIVNNNYYTISFDAQIKNYYGGAICPAQ